jgi:hypothetical protein
VANKATIGLATRFRICNILLDFHPESRENRPSQNNFPKNISRERAEVQIIHQSFS